MDETESGAVSGVKDVLAPGEEFHGYVVDRQIGAGGLGTIWLRPSASAWSTAISSPRTSC